MTAEMSIASSVSESRPSVVTALAPLMIAVLVGFLVIGAALPVLPLHVHDELGSGPVMVGVVAGCQFAASLAARIWSGQAADTQGPKWAVMAGLVGAAISGLLYLLSLSFLSAPRLSIGVLLAGRAVLGGAESFIITRGDDMGPRPRRRAQCRQSHRVDGNRNVRGPRGRRAAWNCALREGRLWRGLFRCRARPSSPSS